MTDVSTIAGAVDGDEMTPDIGQVSMAQHVETAKAKRRVLEARAAGRTLSEIDFYPARPERECSAGFRHIQNIMLHEQDLPCHICGVTSSILRDPVKRADPLLNPWGASVMELHHAHVECQLALAIDLDKFNARIYPWLHRWKPDIYPSPFTEQEVLDWVDHGPENMLPLDDVHHRHRLLGVHSITGPIWGPMDLLKHDFEDFMRTELAKQKAGTL